LVYDISGKVVAEYGGLQSNDEGGVKYMFRDRQGSVRAVLNSAGFILSRNDFQAFGEEIGSNVGLRTTAQGFGASQNLRNRFASTERDEATGLDHTWFRKLEQKSGRWTSPDPYNQAKGYLNPQTWNKYSYVTNQPTKFIDPSGLLQTWCQWWGNFYYPNYPDKKGRTQVGNSWLVCWTVGGGGGGGSQNNNIDLPGGGGTTLEWEGKDKEQADKFLKCVHEKVSRIRRDLEIKVNGIESRALGNMGIALGIGGLAVIVEVIFGLVSAGISWLLISTTVIIDMIAIAAFYVVSMSEVRDEQRIAQNQTDDAFADCAKENNVTLGQAPPPEPPVRHN
jgi:RHS repeat-associated protein